jgi:two-component system, sensor histidine kinase and response regulator
MYKILIIEDEDTIRENIRDILLTDNFIVVEAENGQIGIEMALEEHPHLILCDVMMPEVDGYQVLSEIRLHSATQLIPFIFLTAKTTNEDLRKGMDLGADDYLNKPFTRQGLLNAVTSKLAKQEALKNESLTKLENLRSSLTQAFPREFGDRVDRILGLSKGLTEQYHQLDPEEAIETLGQIYNCGEILSKLTRNVLLYSELLKISNDPERVMLLRNVQKQCDTKTIIEQIAIEKAQQYDRMVDLEMNLSQADVFISQSRIKKIAEELIDNAFKFSLFSTPVQVKTSCKNNIFHLFVIDRSRGMTPEQIDNLGAYMQFPMVNIEQQGIGLGLTIVKLLVEIYGGNLAIESVRSQYTAMHVTLPTNFSKNPA